MVFILWEENHTSEQIADFEEQIKNFDAKEVRLKESLEWAKKLKTTGGKDALPEGTLTVESKTTIDLLADVITVEAKIDTAAGKVKDQGAGVFLGASALYNQQIFAAPGIEQSGGESKVAEEKVTKDPVIFYQQFVERLKSDEWQQAIEELEVDTLLPPDEKLCLIQRAIVANAEERFKVQEQIAPLKAWANWFYSIGNPVAWGFARFFGAITAGFGLVARGFRDCGWGVCSAFRVLLRKVIILLVEALPKKMWQMNVTG